nr:DUF2256 domain-containing protein [Sheuella amnicola]
MLVCVSMNFTVIDLQYEPRTCSMTLKTTFKGNKLSLPSKLCKACGRQMTWRKAWAKNWEHVLYCSNACRKSKSALSK